MQVIAQEAQESYRCALSTLRTHHRSMTVLLTVVAVQVAVLELDRCRVLSLHWAAVVDQLFALQGRYRAAAAQQHGRRAGIQRGEDGPVVQDCDGPPKIARSRGAASADCSAFCLYWLGEPQGCV